MAETKTKPAPAAKETAIDPLAELRVTLNANGFEVSDRDGPIVVAISAIKSIAGLNAAAEKLGLAVAVVLGVELEAITDPTEAAIAALESMKDRIVTVEGQRAELEAKIAAVGTPGTDAAELEALRKRTVELELENKELETDLEEVTNARNSLANQLADSGKGQAPPPTEEPKPKVDEIAPVDEPRPEIARDVGPEFARLTETAIGALIAEGGDFEIAFSNGSFELVELSIPPIKLTGADLQRVDSSRYIVGKVLHVKSASSARIHGAGLLYRGEQVGYCQFSPAIVVHAGQERRFDRALIFG